MNTGGDLPAAELTSFLKEIGSVETWTDKELAKSLRISLSQARDALGVLQVEGYVESAGKTGKWRITEAGELVAEVKPARYTRASVEAAIDSLRDRIQEANADVSVPYTVDRAVLFGDMWATSNDCRQPKSESGSCHDANSRRRKARKRVAPF